MPPSPPSPHLTHRWDAGRARARAEIDSSDATPKLQGQLGASELRLTPRASGQSRLKERGLIDPRASEGGGRYSILHRQSGTSESDDEDEKTGGGGFPKWQLSGVRTAAARGEAFIAVLCPRSAAVHPLLLASSRLSSPRSAIFSPTPTSLLLVQCVVGEPER
jgi:hypothetical protein